MQTEVSPADIRSRNSNPAAFLSLSGLPLSFDLRWPFHPSTSGADFHVLHGTIKLESAPDLHADVAVHLSATVRAQLPSLEPADIEGYVINALRKEVDRKQLEFLKSGKRQPVTISSRYFDFKRKQWAFHQASDGDIAIFLQRKIFWQGRAAGGANSAVWIADPYDALFLGTTAEALLAHAAQLASAGLLTLQSDFASATDALLRHATELEAAATQALADLEAKHQFEKGS